MSETVESFDFSADIKRAMLWDDNRSVNLKSLLEQKEAWYTSFLEGFWNDWYEDVFDIRTANDFGCSVWAIILGIGTAFIDSGSEVGMTFGFSVPNQIPALYDAATWSDVLGAGVTMTAGHADPDGGTNAVRLDFTHTTKSATVRLANINGALTGNVSSDVVVKLISGTPGTLNSDAGGGPNVAWPALTAGGWIDVSLKLVAGSAAWYDLITSTPASFIIDVYWPKLAQGSDAPTSNQNFDNGTFGELGTLTSQLTTTQKRLLLRLRYLRLTSDGCIPGLNAQLANIFEDFGPVYIRDNYDMTITYVFGFDLDSAFDYVLANFDILPRPAGVESLYIFSGSQSFGFDPLNKNFDNGSYAT